MDWELMKSNRHTYGTLPRSFCFLSHPSIRTQIHMPYGEVRIRRSEFNACSVFLQMQLTESKSLRLLSCLLPWAHESQGYIFSPFNGGLFKGVLFHLEEIFIVNLLPVARFQRLAPYVVVCLATLSTLHRHTVCFRLFVTRRRTPPGATSAHRRERRICAGSALTLNTQTWSYAKPIAVVSLGSGSRRRSSAKRPGSY